MLAMSTMMENVPPFKTLLGHALVRDEKGEEMHKSAGNAIWFEDAAEKMGVDVMRWVFGRHNPVNNLNFGYQLGKETERKVFNTLWNVYAFLANYARLDGFDPNAEQVPIPKRQDIDRWLLSNLQLLVRRAHEAFDSCLMYGFVEQAERFIDGLSNWYVRRSRRRFWRTKDESDRDKLAAYQTLYTALVTLCKLIAPLCPFVAERIYQNLVRGADLSCSTGVSPVEDHGRSTGVPPVEDHGQDGRATPESVHLCEYPQADEALIDEALSKQMDAATEVVSAALSVRQANQLRVRQPLSELIVASADAEFRAGVERFGAHILEELNVKSLAVQENLDDVLSIEVRPDMSRLGPRFGKNAGKLSAALAEMAPADVAAGVKKAGGLLVSIDGEDYQLTKEDVVVEQVWPEHLAGADGPAFGIALNTELTGELIAEGTARDIVRHVQQLRKDADLEMDARIRVRYETDDEKLAAAVDTWTDYIKTETLALGIARGLLGAPDRVAKIAGSEIKLAITPG